MNFIGSSRRSQKTSLGSFELQEGMLVGFVDVDSLIGCVSRAKFLHKLY